MSDIFGPRQFDVCGALPSGVTVLEASAGTGKTYTIAALAARYVADGIPLERLLLVTFTRMATGELRERVRERLVTVEQGLSHALAGVPYGNDPVVDSARSILDGHIVLSRTLAERAVYPAIDVSKSVSRVMTDIASPPHLHAARVLRRHLATYEENRDLVLMGAYRAGSDPEIDAAIACHPAVMEFIRQDAASSVTLEDSVTELTGVFGDG